jgi:outer membrane protein assembly factor BamB
VGEVVFDHLRRDVLRALGGMETEVIMRRNGRWALVALVALIALTASACDWNSFGYDGGNTKYNPENILSSGNVGTLKQKWTVGFGYPINSSNTIATSNNGAFVYVSTANGSVVKVNTSDQTKPWTTSIHSSYNSSGAYGLHSSPLVVADTRGGPLEIVVGSTDGHFYALDAGTGAIRWTFPSGTSRPYAPITSSAVATPAGNIAITATETDINGKPLEATLAVLNANTGAVVPGLAADLALDKTGGQDSASSPAIDSRGNVYVSLPATSPCDSGVIAFSGVDTGLALQWTTNEPGLCGAIAPPAVANGRVLLNTDIGLFGLNAATGANLWPVNTDPNSEPFEFGSPAISGNLVFATANGGSLRAVDAATGITQWTKGPVTGPVTSPVATGDLVMATWNASRLVVFSTGGVKEAEVDTSAAAGYGSVAVASGVIYMMGFDGALHAFTR